MDDVDDNRYCISPVNFLIFLIGTPEIRNTCLLNSKSVYKNQKVTAGGIYKISMDELSLPIFRYTAMFHDYNPITYLVYLFHGVRSQNQY